MKILQINKFFYQQGGAERYFFNLIKLLEDNDHEVIPFAMADEKNQPTPWSKFFPAKVETLAPKSLKEKLRIAGRMFYSFEAKRKIENLIKVTKPDLAHLHNIYHQLSPSILPVLKKFKIPVVMTIHDYKLICPNYILYTENAVCERCRGQRYYNAVIHRCLKNSLSASVLAAMEMYFHKVLKIYGKNIDLFIAPSEFVKNKLIKFGFPENKIKVLPHFIELSKDEHKNCSTKNYFFYLGRLKEEKGVDLLLAAMKELPEINLKIVGSGPQETKLKEFVLKNNLDNVKFLGQINAEQLPEIIKQAQGVIIPSRVWETFGLVAAEVMAYGRPVIASQMGALPELIIHGQTGLLFKSEDSHDLADKILFLQKNPEQAKAMGAAGRKIIEEKLNRQQHYQKIMEIYEKVKNK